MGDQKQGEFGFIQGLIGRLPGVGKDVIAGAGDDAGVIKLSDDQYLLATTDALVEGVHFVNNFFRPEDVGRKAVAVNVSDIAAMGGRPTYCLVSLVLPKGLDEDYGTRLYDGIIEECKRYDVQIIGGNVSGGKELVVDVFMLGRASADQVILRSGARVGDKVLVTGSLGEAAAGLQLLLNPKFKMDFALVELDTFSLHERIWDSRLRGNDREKSGNDRKRSGDDKNRGGNDKSIKVDGLISRQLTPMPRVREGLVIAGSGLATSMIDISDGLGQDVGHICDSSGVGVKIYEEGLPVSGGVEEVARKLGKKSWELALSGGEDYELCFTVRPESVEKIISVIRRETGTDVGVVGEILAKEAGRIFVLKSGEMIPLPDRGWDHFGN